MKRLLLLVSLCLNVQAADPPADASSPSDLRPPPSALRSLTTTDGKTYQGIASIKPDGSAVRIIHQDGAATIPYQNIPEPQRAAFGYDPAAPVKDRAAESARNTAAYDQQLAALAAFQQKKAAALQKLRNSYYGGTYYREAHQSYRDNVDREALKTLTKAGFTEPQAKSALANLRAEQAAKPKPKINPAFLQPRGRLRGSPSIDRKKKGAVKK